MRVTIRVDASIDIGTGHVMRCLTLADELVRQGHQCSFVCRAHSGHLGSLIEAKGFDVSLLGFVPTIESVPEESSVNAHAEWLGVSWQQDARQTYQLLMQSKTDWLVVDHYALDARWEKFVAPTVKHIMVIDDMADRQHHCSVLLDQNLGRQPQDYDGLVPEDTLRLIGLDYALLRPEFSQLRDASLNRRKHPSIKRILVTLGGIDRANVTGQVLAALERTSLPRDTKLDIILGNSSPALRQVQDQARLLPFNATVTVNVNDMAERMCLADVSIGAAGSTSWERCCLGLPAIVLVLAQNQVAAAQALKALGVSIVLNEGEDLAETLEGLLQEEHAADTLEVMSKTGARLVDGMGCQRLINELIGRSGTF